MAADVIVADEGSGYEVDWRYLLHAYIDHVGNSEGCTFVGTMRDANAKSVCGCGPYRLTEDELGLIEKMDSTPFASRRERSD